MSTSPEFVDFAEEYKRYKAEISSVDLVFDGLSNDISLTFIAENFIFSTCLRYVDTSCFCKISRRL